MNRVDELIADSLHRHFAQRNEMTEEEWSAFLDEMEEEEEVRLTDLV